MRRTVPGLLSAVLLPLTAAAQPPLPGAVLQPGLFRTPVHSHPGDPGYGTWAGGADFKASFHDGFVFYPRLGEAYPRNLPWRFTVIGVAVGGERLALAESTSHRSSDWRYEFAHGAVVEAYDVRAEGVEQSFVVPRRLPGSGDLTIRGRVDSPLDARAATAAHRALEFADAQGRAVVRYGEAWAFDALGRRTPATTAFAAGEITLTVAGTWLADAVYPVTVDPLTSTVVANTSFSAVSSCDVGQEGDSTSRDLVFAVTRAFSATDHDVSAYACNRDFSNCQIVMTDSSTAGDDRDVRVAYVAGADRWLIVFARGQSVGGSPSSTIRVHFHDRGGAPNSGTARSIPQLFPEFLRAPDVGGTFANGNGPLGLVVFTADPTSANAVDTRVRAMPINAVTRTFLPVYDVESPGCGVNDYEEPSVNQVSAQDEGWIVAFARRCSQGAGGIWDIHCRRVDAGGVLQPGFPAVLQQTGRNCRTPRVSGMNGSFLITFTASVDATTLAAASLWAASIDWPQTAMFPAVGTHRSVATAAPPVTSLRNDGLAVNHFIGSTAVAVYSFVRLGLGGATRSGHAVRLAGRGTPIDSHVLFSVADQSIVSPAVAYAYPGETYAIVYGTTESSPANPVYGRHYQYPADAGELRYGTGCGPGHIDGNRPYLGNHLYRVNCLFAPANTPMVLTIGFGAAGIPLDFLGMTSCAMNIDPTRILTTLPGATAANGNGTIPLPMPDSYLLPFDVWFQFTYVNPGANPAGLQATRGLRAQFR